MIVKNVRWHQTTVNEENSPSFKEQPVAEGKLRLVECDPKEAKFSQFVNQTKLSSYIYSLGLIKGMVKYLKPIITSDLEIVKQGDWIYNVISGEMIQTKSTFTASNDIILKKILVLSDNISSKYCNQIIDGVLQDGNTVLVELERDNYWYKIRYNSTNDVIIHRLFKQTIQYEAMIGVGDGTGKHFVYGNYDTIKLLQDKLLLYEKSKFNLQDLRNVAFQAFIWHNRNEDNKINLDIVGPSIKLFDDWFENNIKL